VLGSSITSASPGAVRVATPVAGDQDRPDKTGWPSAELDRSRSAATSASPPWAARSAEFCELGAEAGSPGRGGADLLTGIAATYQTLDDH